MLVIGLTGGIGSGKSTVASFFEAKGITILDADLVARELTNPNKPALTKIIAHFGNDAANADGSLNRTHLRSIIFSDNKQRVWLEQLLHPLIREQMQAQLKQVTSPYCIAVIPLLLEVEFYSFINRILVIDAPPSEQVKRVMTRDNAAQSDVEAILKSQATREQRRAKAHDVINNDCNIEQLKQQVNRLHQEYLKLAERRVK